ncbi:MAG: hypothetical protein ACRDI2_24250, partial [Chloroflexota bacterium]
MQRRVWLTRLAAGALTPALWSGCGLAPGGTLPGMAGADALVRRPAQQLALVLADLPAGFRFGEEMAPALSTPSAPGGPGGPLGANPGAALPDPWGRLSAYSVTYLAAPAAPLAAGSADARAPTPAVGDVVSSVNAYVGVNEATAAFESWQASIPPVYRRLEQPPPGAPPGAAVYV